MMNFTKAFQSVSMEAQAANVDKKRENEVVIYARITDFDGLKKAASKLIQEQWQVKAPAGMIRVRKQTQEGLDGQYTMTIKTKDNSLGGTETEMSVDEQVFESFKTICQKGMIKDRFCFPVSRVSMRDQSGKHTVALPDLLFEVDVYKNADGSYNEWVKIDLEIDSILGAVEKINKAITTADLSINISDLPFKPVDIIEGSTTDPEQRAKISQLYDEVFLTVRAIGTQESSHDKSVTPVIQETQETEQPVPTGELTGITEDVPTDTAEKPTLVEPQAMPQVQTSEKQDSEDAQTKNMDEPVATDASASGGVVDKGESPNSQEQANEESATQSTLGVNETLDEASKPAQEPEHQPQLDDSVKHAGDENTPSEIVTPDSVRLMIRQELAAFTDALNVKAPAP